jgi:hypothetical protein
VVGEAARSLDRRGLGIGLALLSGVAAWSLLSPSFIYGEGHLDRPILLFLGTYLIAWIAFAAAAYRLAAGSDPGIKLILVVALLARLILLPSGLIQENDVYRYVLDGQVLLHGGNPYEHSPFDLARAVDPSLAASLTDPDAQVVLQRIGYPRIATVYPPMAQVFFALGAWLAGWDWMGQRLVFVAVDLTVILLLVALLGRLGLPRGQVLLYAWNPLVLKEVANSVHLDVLVALFLVLLSLSLIRFGEAPHWLWAALGGLCFALTALTKIYPLILGPACARVLLRGPRPMRSLLLFAGVGASTLVLAVAPFVGIGWNALTAGLTVFAERWRMNEGLFALFDLLTPYPRPLAAAVIVLTALVIPFLGNSADRGRFARDAFWILLVWFLLIPTPYPWYAVPVVALAVTQVGAWPATVVLSGALGLYYLSFHFEYQGHAGAWWAWTRGVEHALIWISIVWCLRRPLSRGRRGQPEQLSHRRGTG